MTRIESIVTQDGSKTLYRKDLDEQYHSLFGAITESKHVFISAGLAPLSGISSVTVFEAGFGTGLNCLLAALFAIEHRIDMHYYTVENFPLPEMVTSQLNYGELLGGEAPALFQSILEAAWDENVVVHRQFTLRKIMADLVLDDIILPDQADVVFFDAFGPDKQPEMWTSSIFCKVAELTASGGVLVTYSAKGEVRRRLASAGFSVERLPGPPGKREMIRGTKK